MKIKNLPELKCKLKTYLPEYLKQQDIKFKGTHIQCINKSAHTHEDLGKLSAAFLPKSNNTVLHCFVEHRNFDIFHAYSILENKRIIGGGFYECIKTLCKRFDIPYEEETEYSLKEIAKNKQRVLLTKLHKLSIESIKKGIPYYKKRKINKDKLKLWKIGFISPDLITSELDKEFKRFYEYKLTDILTHPALLIPVFNTFNQYIGLIARQFGCPDKDDYYRNIFLEEKILFNVNNINSNDYVYLVEGTFDTISMYPETNVIGLITNSLHDRGLELIAKHNFKKIYLALDSDNLYQGEKRDGILRTIFQLKNLDTSINIILLPSNSDPDSYISEHGLDKFKNLPKMAAIKYLLTNYEKELIPIEKIYEFISGNPNIVKKEKFITIVAKQLKIGKRQVTKEIGKLEEKKALYNIITYVQEKEAVTTLLDNYTEMAWNKEFKGLPLGYPLFDSKIGGFENVTYILVGFPETGKTTCLLNFMYQLILNPKNYVAFYSLDDGAKRAIIPRLMSIITGLSSKLMKEPHDGVKDQWNKGMKTLHNLKDNYTIKDGSEIRTVWDLDNFVKIHYAIAQENKKNFIIIIDNLHALTSSYKFESTENAERIANYLKRTPQIFNCPIIGTAEVPKSAGKKPTGSDIKASIDLWYTARFVGGIFSNFYGQGANHLMWTCKVSGEEKMYPIIEMCVSKNQTGNSWHGSLYYKFNFYNNRLIECSAEETDLLDKGQFIYEL